MQRKEENDYKEEKDKRKKNDQDISLPYSSSRSPQGSRLLIFEVVTLRPAKE